MSQTFPPVRLAALDLDGTLLNHEGQVTPRTRAALQAASDRGVVIVPTTGRPLGNLPPVVALRLIFMQRATSAGDSSSRSKNRSRIEKAVETECRT